MTRITLLLAAVLLASAPAFAQKNIQFGIKAGPQLCSYKETNDDKAAFRFHAGVFAAYPIADRFSIQGELLLSTQGVTRKSNTDFKMRTMYLNLPLLARFDATDRINIHAGLQLGFLLSAKLKVASGYYEGTYDYKDDYKAADVAFAVGGAYQFTDHLSAGLRLNLGISAFHGDEDASEARQHVFQLFAAYQL